MTKKYILYWDFDSPIYAACASCEDKYIIAKHRDSGRTKEFKNVTEFWGSKKNSIGGWLSEQPKKWKREDFEIIQKARRNKFPLRKAQEHLENKINFMKSRDFCKELNICIQGRGNFRKGIYPEYKKNRGEKPIVFKELKERFINDHNPIIEDGIETDDTISILQNWSYNQFGKDSEYAFVFIDHDLEQNPCWRVNPSKIDQGVVWIDEDHANRSLFESLLSGDVGDNIVGIDGTTPYIWDKYHLRGKRYKVSKGNAKKLLSDCKTKEEMIIRVQDLYHDYYCDLWAEKLQLNYRLLKLLEKKGELCLDFPWQL